MHYVFKCELCAFKWEKITTDPASERCRVCNRKGLAPDVTVTKKRSDATKLDKAFGAQDMNVLSRPLRASLPTKRAREGEDSDLSDGARDLARAEEVGDTTDVDYVPTPAFDPSLRYSTTGGFAMARIVKTATFKRCTPWTTITAPLHGPRDTNGKFGGLSANVHGKEKAPDFKGAPSKSGKDFEWCHMIADSLGGATSAVNLFCGTCHANTAMLCVENVLRGKTGADVQVEIDLRKDTHVCEKIIYRVRKKVTSSSKAKHAATMFECTIDGLATGCMKEDGETQAGTERKWVRANIAK